MRKDYGECGHETRLLGPRLRPHFESLKDDCRPRRRRRSGTETSFRSGPIPDAGSESVGVVMNLREFFFILFQNLSALIEFNIIAVISASDVPAALLAHH